MDLRVTRVIQDLKENLEQQQILVLLVQLVTRVILDIQDQLVTQVKRVLLVHKEIQELALLVD